MIIPAGQRAELRAWLTFQVGLPGLVRLWGEMGRPRICVRMEVAEWGDPVMVDSVWGFGDAPGCKRFERVAARRELVLRFADWEGFAAFALASRPTFGWMQALRNPVSLGRLALGVARLEMFVRQESPHALGGAVTLRQHCNAVLWVGLQSLVMLVARDGSLAAWFEPWRGRSLAFTLGGRETLAVLHGGHETPWTIAWAGVGEGVPGASQWSACIDFADEMALFSAVHHRFSGPAASALGHVRVTGRVDFADIVSAGLDRVDAVMNANR